VTILLQLTQQQLQLFQFAPHSSLNLAGSALKNAASKQYCR
jgi:hypothetical protein